MPPMMTHDAFAGIVRRADKARDAMRAWFPMFEELAHYFHTTRTGFFTEVTPGQEPEPDIWDSSPEEYRTKLSQSFAEAMCPKDRFWVGMEPERKELMQIDEVRLWCQTASYYMYLVIMDPKANFTEALAELADDSCSFGSAVMLIDYDRPGRHLTFCVKHLKNIAVEVDSNGRLRRFYCFWHMTTEDMIDEFGLDSIPQELRDEFMNAKDGMGSVAQTKHEVIHAIIPDEAYAHNGAGLGRRAYSSLWIMRKGSHLLGKGSYDEIPYILVRWYRKTGEALGRCDAMRAITDARLLQAVASALLEITEKQGNPPMQMPIDIIRGDVELWPGGANFFDASGFQFQGDPIRPVQIGANPAMTAEFMDKLQRKIAKTFFYDLLSLPEDGGSPEQHLSMEMMKSVVLAPLWSRTENETAPPILDRVFNIMLKRSAFPPIPQALLGQNLIYKLDNKIADMRRMAKAKQNFDSLAMPLQLQHPEIVQTAVENVDWDVAFRDMWQLTMVPANYIRPMEQVMADRQQRAQEEQAAKAAQLAQTAGPGAQKMVEAATQARDQGLLPAQ